MSFIKKHTQNKPLVIFEMANNHQGDIAHGLRIIDEYSKLQSNYSSEFSFAFKFQYRDLASFIHPAHRGNDLKYIQRFEETNLSHEQRLELLNKVKECGMLSVCTPFDNASVKNVVDDGYDFLKIASCSLTDWPLLEEIALYQNLPVIASLGGNTDDDISNANAFFNHRETDFALLFCVGMYPTEVCNLNVSMIKELSKRYPNRTIGFSSHEHPDETVAVAVAVGAGAHIFEKHVAIPTEKYTKNDYSLDLLQCKSWLDSLSYAYQILGSKCSRDSNLFNEQNSLVPLRRAIFAKKKIKAGVILSNNDIYFAIPTNSGCLTANDFSKFSVFKTTRVIEKDEPITDESVNVQNSRIKIIKIRNKIRELIAKSGVVTPPNARLEVSHHFGLDKFDEFGMCMITIINMHYCKKLLFLLPGQRHPEQFHKVKHESFFILYGEVELKLNGETHIYKFGELVSIPPGTTHEYFSKNGAVIEELSTESLPGDSFYADDKINQTDKRKSYIDLL